VETDQGCECINDPDVSGVPEQGEEVSPAETSEIPTLSQWGVMLLSLLLTGCALLLFRRRKTIS
jgi:hypothetical protein